ncbi:hypothetical protein [Algibacter aquimarinus]|uniref:VanZ-like domain-containing protein n=1 Tax=Algibacter aquimarinus TaxID=1136748 RepID=A0ABP9HRH6_9FLAO
MRSFFLIFSILFFVFSVLYFSWIASPRFEYNQLVPKWIWQWTDKDENGNLRTAIPLFFLGLFSGLYLLFQKHKTIYWVLVFLSLVSLVFIAELGQLLRPIRIFDWKDIYWGSVGAGNGLLVIFMVKLIKSKIKNNKC